MATKEGSTTLASSRTRATRTGLQDVTMVDDNEEERRVERPSEPTRLNYPIGILKKMPKDDNEINWATCDLLFKVYLKKFPQFYEILNEQIGATDIETAIQREKFGNKIEAVKGVLEL